MAPLAARIMSARTCAGAFGEGGAFAMRTPAEQARRAAAVDEGQEVRALFFWLIQWCVTKVLQ